MTGLHMIPSKLSNIDVSIGNSSVDANIPNYNGCYMKLTQTHHRLDSRNKNREAAVIVKINQPHSVIRQKIVHLTSTLILELTLSTSILESSSRII